MLGSIGATFPMTGQEEQAVIQAVEAQTGDYFLREKGGGIYGSYSIRSKTC